MDLIGLAYLDPVIRTHLGEPVYMDPSNHGVRKVYHGVRKVYHGVKKVCHGARKVYHGVHKVFQPI